MAPDESAEPADTPPTPNPYTYLADRFAAVSSPHDIDWSTYWLGNDPPTEPPTAAAAPQAWPLMPLTADQVRALTPPTGGPLSVDLSGDVAKLPDLSDTEYQRIRERIAALPTGHVEFSGTW